MVSSISVFKCYEVYCAEKLMNAALFKNILLAASVGGKEGIFYLTMHSTHFIYGYMASNIW